MVFYPVFLLSLLECIVTELQKYVGGCVSWKKYVRGCVSLKKQKSQGKAVEMTVNSKKENSLDFCLDFVQEFGVRCPFQVPPLTYVNHSVLSASEDPVSNYL